MADLRVCGLENLPSRGPLILAFNHLGHLDPVLLYITLPTPPEIIGLSEAWGLPFVGWFVRQYGGIPVRRDQFDRAVVAQALAILQNGLMLALAPEARFSTTGQLEQGRTGVAYLAMKADAPILPIGITGTELIGRNLRPRLSLNYGRVMQLRSLPENGVERKRALREETDHIMRAIAALLPEEYRGVYRD
jgi:1-acyl-sn-glycerol-3-phosphate acyltransferase